jgi:hypothetical protein
MSTPEPRGGRLVRTALRCYPARWRRRHADEAAELAVLLIQDGTPAASIAWSYLVGAARARLTPRPGRSLSTVAAALLAVTCLLGFSAALLAETVPAKAAGTPRPPSGPAVANVRPAASGAAPSSPHQVTSCGPVPPASMAGVLPVAGHSQPSIQGTAHARSC